MSYSGWSAITAFHGLGGLNNNVFVRVLEAGKLRIKTLADVVSAGSTAPGLLQGMFLNPHIVEVMSSTLFLPL